MEIRLLRSLVNDRRQAVDIGTMLNNILIDQMKRHFPQALRMFDDLTSPMVCAFLKKWPTLQQAQSSKPETLRKFFYLNHSRSEKLVEKRIQIIRDSRALTDDAAILEAAKIHILKKFSGIAPVMKRSGKKEYV